MVTKQKKNEKNDMYTVFPVHDWTQEQNGSPYFFSINSTVQMAVSVKIQKFCYHNNLTSHFSSLLWRAALMKITQNTAECLKTYSKMNGVLTLFVLAESTQVKWYKMSSSLAVAKESESQICKQTRQAAKKEDYRKF